MPWHIVFTSRSRMLLVNHGELHRDVSFLLLRWGVLAGVDAFYPGLGFAAEEVEG